MQCRVRPNAQLSHNGTVLEAGAEVSLPPRIAYEVRHLVDEVLPSNEVRHIGPDEVAAAELADTLEHARPEHRLGILLAAKDELLARRQPADEALAEVEKLVEAERARRDAAKTAKPAPAAAAEPARAAEAPKPAEKAPEKPADKPAKDTK